jgi:hypothetical protein
MTIVVQCPECLMRCPIPLELIGAELACECQHRFMPSEVILSPSDFEMLTLAIPQSADGNQSAWWRGILQRVSAAVLLALTFAFFAIERTIAATRPPEF